jgi:hypothetical protein
MTEVARRRCTFREAPAVWATTLLLAATAAAGAQAPTHAPRANPEAVALAQLQENLRQYLKLRQDLAGKLAPPSSTSSASELAARQESLATALKQARRDAKPGDLIPPVAARQIARTIADDFRRRKPAATKAVFDEVPEALRPAINKTVPDDAALATVPPLLLNNLPPLPDNLQYRFIRRDVVILDGDTRLIVDYIPSVLPAH